MPEEDIQRQRGFLPTYVLLLVIVLVTVAVGAFIVWFKYHGQYILQEDAMRRIEEIQNR